MSMNGTDELHIFMNSLLQVLRARHLGACSLVAPRHAFQYACAAPLCARPDLTDSLRFGGVEPINNESSARHSYAIEQLAAMIALDRRDTYPSGRIACRNRWTSEFSGHIGACQSLQDVLGSARLEAISEEEVPTWAIPNT
jgi:hypothetical protein